MSGVESASAFQQLLASGANCIGEIAINAHANGGFVLCHRDDVERRDLRSVTDSAELARYDDEGNYRPLKTAPNLKHGWRLVVADERSLERALDAFYPGRLAAIAAFRRGDLRTTALRETLGRHTGMYRVAARISDPELDELVGNFCRSDGGCLRTILWKRDRTGAVPSSLLPRTKFDPEHDQTGRGGKAIPLLCQEACNLLVAAARAVVKREHEVAQDE